MAITQNPIIGRTRNQAGGMVFSTVFGKNIMRSKPATYRKPMTQDAVNRRGKFKAGNELASKVKNYARGLFQNQPVGRSAYSALSSQIQMAFSTVDNATVYDPFEKTIGSGSIPITAGYAYDRPNSNSITLEWDTVLTDPEMSSSDKASFLMTDANGIIAVRIDTNTPRSAGGATLTIPASLSDKSIFVSSPIFTSTNKMLKSACYLADHETPLTA